MINVLIKKLGTNKVITRIPASSIAEAEGIEKGFNIGLNHEEFVTDIEDTEEEISLARLQYEVAQAMFNGLSLIKGFDMGMSSRTDKKLIMDFKDNRYVVSINRIPTKPHKNMFEDIKTYLTKDEV